MGNVKRYHRDVYFEEFAEEQIKSIMSTLTFYPTSHMMQKTLHRKLPFPSKSLLMNGSIFEYYREGKDIIKFCVRCEYGDKDVCFAVADSGRVVTGWWNKKKDTHITLDKSLYEKGA